MKNRIELNLPQYSSGKPPNPDQPIFKLNGQAMDIVSIEISAGGESFTEVSLRFYAEVTGIVEIDKIEELE